MNSKFEHLVNEQYNSIMTKTVRSRFPRQIKFSNEFIEAIQREYCTQVMNESADAPVKDRSSKFIKALGFVVSDIVENLDSHLESYSLTEKDTNCSYAAEGCDCDGCDDCHSNKVVEEKDHCECDHAARGCCCDGCKDCRHNHSQLKAS